MFALDQCFDRICKTLRLLLFSNNFSVDFNSFLLRKAKRLVELLFHNRNQYFWVDFSVVFKLQLNFIWR